MKRIIRCLVVEHLSFLRFFEVLVEVFHCPNTLDLRCVPIVSGGGGVGGQPRIHRTFAKIANQEAIVDRELLAEELVLCCFVHVVL